MPAATIAEKNTAGFVAATASDLLPMKTCPQSNPF
jgi:hypothetical protein